jgi:Flp pilus assembly protein TadG
MERSAGQSLVEFALVFPIFMLILGGIIQFGMIFWGQNTLNQIVRDAGRYAVTQPNCSPASRMEVEQKISELASNSSLAATLGTKIVTMPTADSPDPCPATSNTQHVWLTIEVHAQVPIFFPLVPGNGAIASTAQFRMEPVAP